MLQQRLGKRVLQAGAQAALFRGHLLAPQSVFSLGQQLYQGQLP